MGATGYSVCHTKVTCPVIAIRLRLLHMSSEAARTRIIIHHNKTKINCFFKFKAILKNIPERNSCIFKAPDNYCVALHAGSQLTRRVPYPLFYCFFTVKKNI